MEGKLSELTKIFHLVAPQDVGTADIDSTVFVPAKDYRKFRAVAAGAQLTVGQTLTIALLQAQSASGTGKKLLGATVTHTAAGTETHPKAEVEANQEDLDSAGGFAYVGIRVGSGTNSIVGCGILECGQPVHLPAD